MQILDFLHSQIECKFGNTSFQVWAIKPKDKHPKLIYRKGENEFLIPPSLLEKQNNKYVVDHQTQKTFLYFLYPEDFEVRVSLIHENVAFQNDELESLYFLFSHSFTQEMIIKKEAELESLVESIRSITSALDLDELLRKIMKNALAVIPGADAGYLQLYDADSGLLIPKAAVGFNEFIQSFKVKVGESITGKVFKEGKPKIILSKEEIYREMSDLSDENLHYIHAAEEITEIIQKEALISVPVSMGENKIGVMTVNHRDNELELTEQDLNLLQGYASQVAIAIQNAQQYTEIKTRLEEVTQLSEELRERNQFLLKRNEIHDTLTKISLQNKGVETILFEITKIMDRPGYFFDYLEQECYPKKTNLPFPFSYDEISTIFSKRRKPVYVDIVTPQNQTSFYLYPIFSGMVFIGCFINSLMKPLSELDHITLEQSGSIMALELVKKQSITDVYYKKTHEFFNELLQNKDQDFLMAKGTELGLDLSSFLSTALFEITSFQDLQKLGANIHRLASKIKKVMGNDDILLFGFHNKVTILISMKDPSSMLGIITKLKSILTEWDNWDGPPLRLGVGSLFHGIGHISRSYEEAIQSLKYLASRNQKGMMRYEDIGINRLFLNQEPHEIQRFLDETLSPLWTDKNKTNDNELEKTLFTYVALNKSAIETAKQLHIHINTLYHRIKKIEEILGLDFNDPSDFLKIQLACHLRSTFSPFSSV